MTAANQSLADVRKIFGYVVTHIDAGRDLSNPKLVKDLKTALRDLHAVLDVLEQPPTTKARVAWLVRETQRLETLVSALGDQIQAAADATGAKADAAANRVIDLINSDRTALADLQAKSDADDVLIAALQAQIDAGTITPEAAQAVVDSLTATNAKLDDLDSDPLTPV